MTELPEGIQTLFKALIAMDSFFDRCLEAGLILAFLSIVYVGIFYKVEK